MAGRDCPQERGGARFDDRALPHPAPLRAMVVILRRLEAARQHFTRLGDGSVICVRPEGTVCLRLVEDGIRVRFTADGTGRPALQAEFEAHLDGLQRASAEVAE